VPLDEEETGFLLAPPAGCTEESLGAEWLDLEPTLPPLEKRPPSMEAVSFSVGLSLDVLLPLNSSFPSVAAAGSK